MVQVLYALSLGRFVIHGGIDRFGKTVFANLNDVLDFESNAIDLPTQELTITRIDVACFVLSSFYITFVPTWSSSWIHC